MKFIYTLATFMILGIGVQAQNLSITNNYHTFWGNIWDQMGGVTLDVTNNSANDISIQAIRAENLLATGHETYFCFGPKCYDSSTDSSDVFVTIPAGATISSSLIHYCKPLGNAGTTEAKYCFVSTTNSSDSICFRFTYIASVTGIEENDGTAKTVELSPNPSGDIVSVKFSSSVKEGDLINIIDAAGRSIHTEVISGNTNGLAEISVMEWAEGIYFVGIQGTGKFSKLSVKH